MMQLLFSRRVLAPVVALALSATACGPRQVEVRTAPSAAAQNTVQVDNGLTQSVNVYVTSNGTDTFLRQVPAKSSVSIPLQGFQSGSPISLKAVTVDGVHTYSRNNVTVSGTFVFPLP